MKNEWQKQMEKVYEALPIDPKKDLEASATARRLFKPYKESILATLNVLQKIIKDKCIVIFGAGPSLDESLEECLDILNRNMDNCTYISADGATSALLMRNIIPQIIVTDFDGDLHFQIEALNRGAILVLHWHGDNYVRLKKIHSLQVSLERVVPTVQVNETKYVPNFGGFTDGDRAAYLARYFRARKIVLIGFDLGEIVGKHSKPTFSGNTEATPFKKIKLQIAKEFIEDLASNIKIYQYFPQSLDNKNMQIIKHAKMITLPLLESILLE